jgi:multicomponent Na+:H+ antiporter subunit F
LSTVIMLCLVGVAIAALLCVAKLLVADSYADRIVALDLLLGVIVTGIGVAAAGTGDGVLLNLLVVTGLIGFVGTVTVARFVEGRGV